MFAQYIREHFNPRKVTVITSLYPPFPEDVQQLWGGIEVDMECLVNSFREIGIKTSIVAFDYIKPIEKNEAVYRVGQYYPYLLRESYKASINFAYKEFFRPIIFFKLLRILLKEKPDLVVVGKTYQFSLALYLACSLLKIPYVVRYDWLCPTNPKPEICSFRDRLRCANCVEKITGLKIPLVAKIASSVYFMILFSLKKIFWNKSKGFFVVSDFYKRVAVSFGVKSSIIDVIPPETEIKIDPNVVEDLKNTYKPNGEKVILYVGRLEPEKGVNILLDAFKNIKRSDVKLLMAGTGRLKDIVEVASRKDDRIVYLGLVPHDQLGNYYAIADLVVVPSIVPEGYGLVVKEAMSLNKPIIGFEMGALIEILKDYDRGYLVKEVSAEALSKTIDRVLKNLT